MNKIEFVALALLSILMSACATNSIPQDKQKNYALLVPNEKGGSPDIVLIDQETFHRTLLGTSRDVLPGRHSIRMETCFPNKANALAPICKQRDYVIDAVAGLAYKFKDQYTIEVADRFDLGKFQYNLVRIDNSVFLTPEAAKQLHDKQVAVNAERYSQEMKEKATAQAATMERRRNNLPLVRKIGTHVCQEREDGVIYIGYVEDLADENVQIRIAGAHYKDMPSVHPSGFSQSDFWDSPMNWDLCE